MVSHFGIKYFIGFCWWVFSVHKCSISRASHQRCLVFVHCCELQQHSADALSGLSVALLYVQLLSEHPLSFGT